MIVIGENDLIIYEKVKKIYINRNFLMHAMSCKSISIVSGIEGICELLQAMKYLCLKYM